MLHELFTNPETLLNLHHKAIETTNNTPNSPAKKADNPTRTLIKVFAEEKINLTPIAEPSKTPKTDNPGELALAVTLESVTLPADLVGWLDGRSSLARLGLMVHVTAHRIDPGWSGCIVLEFYNSGKLPLALRPGMLIGALSFEPLSGPAARPYNRREDAKYRNQQGAVASRIDKD